jgi:hypothetical protein
MLTLYLRSYVIPNNFEALSRIPDSVLRLIIPSSARFLPRVSHVLRPVHRQVDLLKVSESKQGEVIVLPCASQFGAAARC